MQKINVNIEEFYRRFLENYQFLYDNFDNVAGYIDAVLFFDSFLEMNADFVRKFAEYRRDFITSDREAAAFSFTLDDMGVIASAFC